MGNSVVKSVQAFFFQSGCTLSNLNHTFITLIPKVDNSSAVNRFRLISLCSTIYKVLANRLKVVLGKIIHPFQGALVPEHLI